MKVLKFVVKTLTNLGFIGVTVFFSIYGYLYITDREIRLVQSGSMEPAIETGSIILIDKNVPYDEIIENDVIAFRVGNALVTHRVISITEKGLETKGDANTYSDGISTTEDNYYGKTVGSYPMLGKIYMLLKSQRGIVLWITFATVLYLANRLFEEQESLFQTKI